MKNKKKLIKALILALAFSMIPVGNIAAASTQVKAYSSQSAAIQISENIGVEKPNKEFFDYVFGKLGITDKGQVLIIGDSLTSDIKGGNVAGIDTCWFNPKHKANTLGVCVNYEIDELKKLYEIL